MEAEQALDEVDECFKILSAVVNCSSVPVQNSKFDVIAELTKSLLLNLSRSPLEWAQQLSQSDSSCPPSTSQTPDKVTDDDPRIFLGHILGEIYENLSKALKNSCSNTDEVPSISVQNEYILNASLQFYILAQVLPYLDEGIGIPIYKRSNYLKSWARIIENVDIRKIQLRHFISVIHKLLDCSVSMKAEVLKVFLADVICAVEQLSNLGESPDEWVTKMIEEIPKHDIIIVLMSLTKIYEKTKPIPIWFTTAIGRLISTILYSTDGLFHVLGVYAELGGESFWENSHLLCQIARQLALPPRNAKRMAYFEHINQQFLELLLQKQVFPKNGILQLYSTFVDSMALKEPLAADVLVLDKLLQPFEILFEISHDQVWDSKMSSSLTLLSFMLEDRFCPQVLFKTDRVFQIIPLFTAFLLSQCFDAKNIPTEIKSIMENILKVLKYLAGRVENLGQLLFSFIVEDTFNLYEIVSVKRFVSIIGEETDNKITVHQVQGEEEDILMRKLDAVLKFIKELEKPTDACVLIEILCESAHSWTNLMESNEELRFVKGATPCCDVKKKRNASHVAALFCFEQLGEWDVNAENPKVIEALTKLITTILNKSVERIQSEKGNSFDISSSIKEEESRMIAIQKTSTKMAVGLAAAVVAASTVASTTYLNSITEALSHYVTQESAINDEELLSAVKDAKDILLLLNAVGIKVETKRGKAATTPKETSLDFLTQLKNDLEDEMVPVRGQALIRISRALRSKGDRKHKVVSVLDKWLYEKVKDLLQDSDSYVYLAAINALAEITCLNVNRYLDQLLNIYIQLSQNTADITDDSLLMMRGKLAETIAKIFHILGDISPVWIDRTANVFFTSLKDKSDIVRASSLSAFADFVLSCRGKGIQKVLEELLFAIDSLLKTDNSDLVRRAAVHLLRNLISSCGAEIFSILGDHLRDLHRTLRRLWKYDRDHVVRLHAEICLEEMSAGLKSSSVNYENITIRPIAI